MHLPSAMIWYLVGRLITNISVPLNMIRQMQKLVFIVSAFLLNAYKIQKMNVIKSRISFQISMHVIHDIRNDLNTYVPCNFILSLGNSDLSIASFNLLSKIYLQKQSSMWLL